MRFRPPCPMSSPSFHFPFLSLRPFLGPLPVVLVPRSNPECLTPLGTTTTLSSVFSWFAGRRRTGPLSGPASTTPPSSWGPDAAESGSGVATGPPPRASEPRIPLAAAGPPPHRVTGAVARAAGSLAGPRRLATGARAGWVEGGLAAIAAAAAAAQAASTTPWGNRAASWRG